MRMLLASSLALLFSATAVAQEEDGAAFTPQQRAAFGDMVRAYLMDNPEVVEDALIELQAKREREEAARAAEQIAANAERLYNDPRDYAVGPADAKVTIVEFFDYNCSFCKRSAAWMADLVERHGDDVRVVFKEAPIFGEPGNGSEVAARAALAAIEQGKYMELHFALMEAPGSVTPEFVESTAKSLGIDWRKIKPALVDPEMGAHTDETLELGRLIGMSGTPTFVVNGTLVGGANFAELDRLVTEGLAQDS